MARSLSDYLKTAGIVSAATPATTEQPKTAAAPAQPAAPAPAPKVAEPVVPPAPPFPPKKDEDKKDDKDDKKDGKKDDKDDDKKEAAVQPGQVIFDPSIIKTAEQKWLFDNGYGLITDPNAATVIINSLRKTAEVQQKVAQQTKEAELNAMGESMYRGIMKVSTAMSLAAGDMDLTTANKIAAMLGLDMAQVLAAARQMKQAATDVEVAAGPSAFFGGNLATPARSGSSETQSAADRCANTVQMPAPALPGDTTPARGVDEKLLRFTEAANLPNNPGLNHGQTIAPAKGG